MPPRTRRILAQQTAEEKEEEDGASSSKNSSLRSFFPLEVVNLILRELNDDPPSLAAVCLVSFGCLEEASGSLYRDVVIKSEKGLISFTCGANLSTRSRLASYLSLTQVRTLAFPPLERNPIVRLTPNLVEKGGRRPGVCLPPRLLTPIPLDRLLIATFPSTTHSQDADRCGVLELFLVFIFPHLRPTHVEITTQHLAKAEDAFPRPTQSFDWLATLRAWNETLKSMSMKTWIPFKTSGSRFFLRDSPLVCGGGSFELTLDVSAWPSSQLLKIREVVFIVGTGTEGMSGLKVKVVVRKDVQKALEGQMVRGLMKEEERERIELVGV